MTFTQLAGYAPGPIAPYAPIVFHKDRLIAFGDDRTYALPIPAGTWSRFGSLPWACRRNFAVVATPEGLVLLGGDVDTMSTNDVFVSRYGDSWQSVGPAPWPRRSWLCAVYVNGSILVYGGRDIRAQRFNDVWASPDMGRSWNHLPNAPWTPRFMATGVVFNGSAYILAGDTADRGTVNDVWSSPDGGRTWNPMATPPWGIRFAAASVSTADKLYLLGGQLTSVLGDIWVSTDGNSWTQVPDTTEPGLGQIPLAATTSPYDPSIFLGGGSNRGVWVTQG